jgi:ABC-type branched-subunit amino acid transport system ATPase component
MIRTLSTPALAFRGVSRRFGGISALDGVSFVVAAGSICGLIGPNGAGKTTLLNVTCGMYRPDAGSVELKGADITSLPTHKIAGRGLARSFQNIRLFDELTVRENVDLGYHLRRSSNVLNTLLRLPAGRADLARSAERTDALLDELGLTSLGGLPAGALSYGDKRRVEIARALAADPAV